MSGTRWLILIIVAVILLIDLGLLAFLGLDGTISTEITRWSHDVPFIPFAGGFLCGHFWAGGKSTKRPFAHVCNDVLGYDAQGKCLWCGKPKPEK